MSIAFVVAPLMVPIVLVLGNALSQGFSPPEILVDQMIIYGGCAYVVTGLSAPVLILLWPSCKPGTITMALTGAIIGLGSALALFSLFGVQDWVTSLYGAVAGALSGWVFYKISGIGRRR